MKTGVLNVQGCKCAQELCTDKVQILCDKKVEGQIVDNVNVEVMHVYIDLIDKLKKLDF